MDNQQPIAFLISKSKPTNYFSLKNFTIFCLIVIAYYAIGYIIQNPFDLTAQRKPFSWFFLIMAIFYYIALGITNSKMAYQIKIFRDYLLADIGYDKKNSYRIEPSHIQNVVVIQQVATKRKFKLILNAPKPQFPNDLDSYHYSIKLNFSPAFENKIQKNGIYLSSQDFEQQSIHSLVDWLNFHNIQINQVSPLQQGEDIGKMPLVILAIGVLGGIAIATQYPKIGTAYHLVGNYFFLLIFAVILAFFISLILIKFEKKALWFATTIIGTLCLTPMLYGLSMKSYELYHEHQVKSQNLRPNYEFEFVLTKNEKDKQKWEIINVYQTENGKYSKTEQPQFRDLSIYAEPNSRFWQSNVNTNTKISVPVYQIGEDWFFAYQDFKHL